jgi:hypothetical protein
MGSSSKARQILWESTFAYGVAIPANVNRDDYIHGYTRSAYDEALEKCHMDERNTPERRSVSRDVVFATGLLLVANGNLEVLEETLNSVPEEYDNRFHLLDYLLVILPLPEDINNTPRWFFEAASRIREWYREHQQGLVWSQEQGKFLLQQNDV